MSRSSRIFTVLADWEIRNPEIYRTRIWVPAKAKGIARMPWLNALTLTFRFDGRVFWPSGQRFEMPEIDRVFPDPQNRWMSIFLQADKTGRAPKRHCRVIPRLRLIALYCDITADRAQDLVGAGEEVFPGSLPIGRASSLTMIPSRPDGHMKARR